MQVPKSLAVAAMVVGIAGGSYGIASAANGSSSTTTTATTTTPSQTAPPSGAPQPQNYPRSALLHSTFLARAHLMQGNLEQGVQATRYALDRLGEVQSPRGRMYLRSLRPALARRRAGSRRARLRRTGRRQSPPACRSGARRRGPAAHVRRR